MTQQDLGSNDEAIRAAEEVKRLTNENNNHYFEAEYIIVDLKLSGAEKINRLQELERESRKKGFSGVANNIALQLAYETETFDEEAKLLDRVLESDKEGYTNASSR